MKTVGNSIGVWLLAMVASLIGAYWASIPKGVETGQLATQNLEIDAITRLELSLGTKTVEASRENKTSSRWWIANNTAEPGEGGLQKPEGTGPRFLASEKFLDYLRVVATFPVIREIGNVASDKLTSFGLDTPTGSMVIKGSSGLMAEFFIGKQPYGARSYYVMRAYDKKVFLIGSDIIEDFLKPESRFFERRISVDTFESAQSVAMTLAGKTKTFVRLNQADSRTTQWVEKGSQTPVPAMGTWLDKFSEIRAAAYADDTIRKSLSARSPNLTVRSIDKKGNANSVALFIISASDKTECFVVSDFLGWPVKVASARAENLLKDSEVFFQNQ